MATTNVTTQPVESRETWEAVLEVGSLIVVGVVGVCGNLLLLATIALNEKLRKPSNGFLCNLSIADLLMTLIVVPIMVPTRIYRTWLFGDILCQLHGFIVFLSIYASLFTHTALAINRVVMVKLPQRYPKLYTTKSVHAINGFVWFIALVCCVMPLLGWGRYQYDTKRDNCLFDRKAAPSYSLFMAAFGITMPMVTSAVCYVMVLIGVIQQRRQISAQTEQPTNRIRPDQLRLTRNLFVVWIVFFLCWAPMNFMLFSDPKGLIARAYYMAAIWLLICNSCVNPVLYGLMTSTFRTGYKKTVYRIFCCKRLSTQELGENQSQTQTQHAEKRTGSVTESSRVPGVSYTQLESIHNPGPSDAHVEASLSSPAPTEQVPSTSPQPLSWKRSSDAKQNARKQKLSVTHRL